MEKLKVTFTGECDDTTRDMNESEFGILIKLKPSVYIDGDTFNIEDFTYDAESGEFRIGLTKQVF